MILSCIIWKIGYNISTTENIHIGMEENMINVPKKVQYIIESLMSAGYEAYIVGGCVRDSLLEKEPDDWDITTTARPDEIKKLFVKTVDTGIQHGTVTVIIQGECFEITTYRIDGEYVDGRHPTEVQFTSNLVEDLKRRDFTINAMAYNPIVGLVDIFRGQEDIEKKIIRCVGNAQERFQEDALRIMRAVRFAAQLGYCIEPITLQAIQELAPTLQKISAERIQVELTKLLTSKNPQILELAFQTGITNVILPEFDILMEIEQHNPHHQYSVGMHTLQALKQVEADKNLRLAVLFHDMGKAHTKTVDRVGIDHFYGHAGVSKKIVNEVLKRLRFDNKTIRKVSTLVENHDNKIETNAYSIRCLLRIIGRDNFIDLLKVKRADVLAQSNYKQKEKLEHLELLEEIYNKIVMDRECISIKELDINGKDILELGLFQGKEVGEILEKLLDLVIINPNLNKKNILLDKIKELMKQ